MKSVAFFNNQGGVGATSLVYHLSWMFRELGVKVVACDFDPQSSLSAAFLLPERLEALWPEEAHTETVVGAVGRLMERRGDLAEPHVEEIEEGLGLVVGDSGLSRFEDRVSEAWGECLDDQRANRDDAFRVLTSFYRIAEMAAQRTDSPIVLLDVAPNLAGLNRGVMAAADVVVVPVAGDVFSLQGLRNLGPALREWRRGWVKRRSVQPSPTATLSMPPGEMRPMGYVVVQSAVRREWPARAGQHRRSGIAAEYRHHVLGDPSEEPVPEPDPHQLASLKYYRSLMPLAQDAGKPMFLLRAADGAIGSHAQAVFNCYRDFEGLARRIARECGLDLPDRAGLIA